MELSAASREISAGMTALSDLVAGERGRRASEVLERVLVRVKLAGGRMDAGGQALAGVSAAARRIAGSFSMFRDTVSRCRVLGSLIRIETARLGDTGSEFGNLAAEVKSLTGTIGRLPGELRACSTRSVTA